MQYTKNMFKPASINDNQSGFASIVIALTIIIVMALITVGFAQLSAREQQDSLNNQLANEANYAAESGLNQGVAELNAEAAAGTLTSKANCGTDSSSTYLKTNILGPDVSWTCLTIDTVLPKLVFSNVAVDKGNNIAFTSGSKSGFHKLIISWSSNGRADSFLTSASATNDLLTDKDWNDKNYSPAISFTITDADSLHRNDLINGTYTAMLMPYAANLGKGEASVSAGSSPTIPKVGSCTATSPNQTYACKATIILPSGINPKSVGLNFSDFYYPANISIAGEDSANGTQTFYGGQAIVDSTGKAQDVLKRLQARVQVDGPSETLPSQSLEVGSVCKRVEALPPEGTTVNNVINAPAVASDGDVSSCNLN